jgi:hypothetical protein
MSEILASVEDVNAYLDEAVVKADDTNTELLQISVARIVRGYLAGVVDNLTLASWSTPEDTPDIIRECASMLIASQLFFDKTILSTVEVDQRHYAQLLYDRAMAILQGLVDGTIVLEGGGAVEPVGAMSSLDFFPIDDTDRAFTMGMQL